MSQSDKGKPLLSKLGAEEHIANASENGVDGSKGVKSDRSAPTTEGRDDENELRTHTDTVGLAGLDATPLIVAEGMMARVGAPTASYPGFPYDLDMGAGEEGTQGDISIPMDEDEEELQPSFGVLSNTTFDPSLAYQPHSYSHGLNIEQGGLIVEDVETEFVADSIMEDTGMESWNAEASVKTEILQPFSWIPPPIVGAFQAISPNVPPTQMTTFVNPAMAPPIA